MSTFGCLFCSECVVIWIHSFICFSSESFFTSVERQLTFPHFRLSAEASLLKPYTNFWLLYCSLGNKNCFLSLRWHRFGFCLTSRLFFVLYATQFLHFVWQSNSASIMCWLWPVFFILVQSIWWVCFCTLGCSKPSKCFWHTFRFTYIKTRVRWIINDRHIQVKAALTASLWVEET